MRLTVQPAGEVPASMPSRVLLISANLYEVPYPVFPLGLVHLNAALRAAGHQTRWVDCLCDAEPIEQVVADFQPDLVGISLRNIDDIAFRKRETFYGTLLELCGCIRRCSKARIVVGGSGYSIFPERLLERSGADFGIQGEGETGLLALLEALERGDDHRGIPGLVCRDDGGIRRNPQSPDRLDRVVSPEDRPERLIQRYLDGSLMLNLQTQRGCSFDCCYCTYPVIEGRRHRRRPPEMVADELAELEGRGARHVSIVDSVFNSSPTHVVETCEAILRRGVRIKWSCFLRPQGLTAGHMSLMARAGLTHVEFGSDSFSDRVLQSYGKNLRFDEIRQASELAAGEGLEQCHFLILGGPGESKETIEETLANSRSLHGVIVLPVVGMRVYPGTSLHARAVSEGIIREDSDLLEPCHYVAPGLTAEFIFDRLAEIARTDRNWIVGDPPASFHELVERLRRRGIAGPLWTYFTVLQRLAPPPAGSAAP